jgi:hypothetical protein
MRRFRRRSRHARTRKHSLARAVLRGILCSAVYCLLNSGRATNAFSSGKRLSGTIYFLVPVETAVVSALAIYAIAAFFPADYFVSLLILVLAPPIVWPFLHITFHRYRAANA